MGLGSCFELHFKRRNLSLKEMNYITQRRMGLVEDREEEGKTINEKKIEKKKESKDKKRDKEGGTCI